jgi:hypothetical protein
MLVLSRPARSINESAVAARTLKPETTNATVQDLAFLFYNLFSWWLDRSFCGGANIGSPFAGSALLVVEAKVLLVVLLIVLAPLVGVR